MQVEVAQIIFQEVSAEEEAKVKLLPDMVAPAVKDTDNNGVVVVMTLPELSVAKKLLLVLGKNTVLLAVK